MSSTATSPAAVATGSGRTFIGVGGWTYAPWRDNFYPKGLPQHQELHFASRALTAIEVNGTYYSTFKPPTFAKWRDEAPEGFVFSLKATRFATNRRVLATAGESVQRFVESGISELGDKLGPIVWQFMPTKQFDAQDFETFLALLPPQVDGRALRHVLDVRHESFTSADYLALARRYNCTTVFTDSPKFPHICDAASQLAYLRLMQSEAACATGYPPGELDKWAAGAAAWTRARRHVMHSSSSSTAPRNARPRPRRRCSSASVDTLVSR